MKYSSRNSFKISTIQKDMKFERAENNMNVLSVFKSAMTFFSLTMLNTIIFYSQSAFKHIHNEK